MLVYYYYFNFLLLFIDSEDTVEYFCAGEKKTLSSAIKSSLPKKKRIEKKQKVNDNVHEEEMPKNIYHEVEVTAEEIEKYSVYVEKPLYVTQSMKKKSNELTANDPVSILDILVCFCYVCPLILRCYFSAKVNVNYLQMIIFGNLLYFYYNHFT